MFKEKTMKKIFVLMMAAAMVTACSKDVMDESPVVGGSSADANSLLQVTTRGSNDAVVAYPVQVYVFQGDNRTWTASANAYLLPPSSTPASISVNITTASGTKSYTYSTSDELEAGYKINISGTYTEAMGVSLTGTITGATWLGERTISFDFDESGG